GNEQTQRLTADIGGATAVHKNRGCLEYSESDAQFNVGLDFGSGFLPLSVGIKLRQVQADFRRNAFDGHLIGLEIRSEDRIVEVPEFPLPVCGIGSPCRFTGTRVAVFLEGAIASLAQRKVLEHGVHLAPINQFAKLASESAAAGALQVGKHDQLNRSLGRTQA